MDWEADLAARAPLQSARVLPKEAVRGEVFSRSSCLLSCFSSLSRRSEERASLVRDLRPDLPFLREMLLWKEVCTGSQRTPWSPKSPRSASVLVVDTAALPATSVSQGPASQSLKRQWCRESGSNLDLDPIFYHHCHLSICAFPWFCFLPKGLEKTPLWALRGTPVSAD